MCVKHLRNGNFKHIILNKLLPQHNDSQLNTHFNKTATWRTLDIKHMYMQIVSCIVLEH